MLSDTREAIINLDKTGVIKDYAKMRKMDEDYIRDVVLADFGLNPSGKKEYDLGSKIIVVSFWSF